MLSRHGHLWIVGLGCYCSPYFFIVSQFLQSVIYNGNIELILKCLFLLKKIYVNIFTYLTPFYNLTLIGYIVFHCVDAYRAIICLWTFMLFPLKKCHDKYFNSFATAMLGTIYLSINLGQNRRDRWCGIFYNC